jgi:hypothetical protein
MNKREQLIDMVRQYVEDGRLNLSSLRVVDKSLYTRICSVFESMSDFKEAIKPIECYYQKNIYTKKSDSVVRVTFETKTLRNRFAYEHINMLRKTMTYEEISSKYSVSKQNVQQLHQSLTDLYS